MMKGEEGKKVPTGETLSVASCGGKRKEKKMQILKGKGRGRAVGRQKKMLAFEKKKEKKRRLATTIAVREGWAKKKGVPMPTPFYYFTPKEEKEEKRQIHNRDSLSGRGKKKRVGIGKKQENTILPDIADEKRDVLPGTTLSRREGERRGKGERKAFADSRERERRESFVFLAGRERNR